MQIDTNKATEITLRYIYKQLVNNGEVNPSVSFNAWIAENKLIKEPAKLSYRIKDIVFNYMRQLATHNELLQYFDNFDKLQITNTRKPELVIVKQLSIYFYEKTFNQAPHPTFSREQIANIHGTTAENVLHAIKTVQNEIDTNKYVAQIAEDLTQRINKNSNNSTLKIA